MRKALFIVALITLVAPMAFAATSTTAGNTVTASVAANCTISWANLPFGAYNGLGTANLDAQNNVTVTCTNTTAYSVGLNLGANATGAQRRMNDGGTNYLNYDLYSDNGRSTAWGNTVGTDTVAGTGTGAAQTLTVYGRVPSGQTPAPGSYTDTITATVNF